jgi:dTDP-4-dehydrorhamnose reductase
MKVLILGGTGLLGNALLNTLGGDFYVVGTSRNKLNKKQTNLIYTEDLFNFENLKSLIDQEKPNVIINCLSINDIKSQDFQTLRTIYTLIPQYLSFISIQQDIKLVHISSDAVFSGDRGNYSEKDQPDPNDIYGMCKLFGEPLSSNSSIIRTSMIGHSLQRDRGLLDWFINQSECKLYKNAIFSGLPVYELARIISKHFINNSKFNGLFHIASQPISKYELLNLVKNVYNLNINIIPDKTYFIDRSLDSSKFTKLSGYNIPSWSDMITKMKEESFKR